MRWRVWRSIFRTETGLDVPGTHMAAEEAEARYAREEAREHEKAPELKDGDLMRERVKRIREFQSVEKVEPGEKRYGEGVLKCPQCGTAYVFDPDNKHCQACATKLHDGKRFIIYE